MQYDQFYEIEYQKLIWKLYNFFWERLPEDCINNIEHATILYPKGKYVLKGFYKKYKGIVREFILNENGEWKFKTSLYINQYFPLTDEDIKQFVTELKDEYLKAQW